MHLRAHTHTPYETVIGTSSLDSRVKALKAALYYMVYILSALAMFTKRYFFLYHVIVGGPVIILWSFHFSGLIANN